MQIRPPLLLLTLAVVVAHAWVLAAVTVQDKRPVPSPAPTAQVFATRTIAPAPATAPAGVPAGVPATSMPSAGNSAATRRGPSPQPARVRAAAQRKAQARQRPPAANPLTSPPVPVPSQVWQMASSAELLSLEADELLAPSAAPTSAEAPDTDAGTDPGTNTGTAPGTDTDPDKNPASAMETETATAVPGDPAGMQANPAPAAAASQESDPDIPPTAAPHSPDGHPAAPPAAPSAVLPVATTPVHSATPQTARRAAVSTPLPAPVPIRLPAPRRLSFEVTGKAKGLGYNALAELVWEHDADSYRAHQEVKVLFLGARSQTSVGSITAWGLQPRRFGDKARSERAAHFDFAAGRVTFSANTPPAPIEPGAQDRLSVFLQLGAMLAAAPERYPAGTDISMTTVSARGADVWTFAVQAEETLNLPLGSVTAVPLTRLPRREYDQKAQVWLAPSLGYLPARIRITEANGDFVELNLRSEAAP